MSNPTPADEPKAQLPPEIWTQILQLVQNPIPRAMPRPDRSALRQPGLVAASLTCKLLAALCQRLLYKRIVTDNLPALLQDLHTPSSCQRFKHTQALFIEYPARVGNPTYEQILRKGVCLMYVGQTMAEVQDLVYQQFDAEIPGMHGAFISVHEAGMKRVFPRLETVAVASICGSEARLWALYTEGQFTRGESPSPRLQLEVAFQRFLASGNLQYVCTREGPLALRPLSYASSPDTLSINYGCTQHFGPRVQNLAYSLGGVPNRWVSDVPDNEPWSEVLDSLGATIARLAMVRERDERSGGVDVAELDIYCSTSIYPSATTPPSDQDFAGLFTGGGVTKPHLSVADQQQLAGVIERRILHFNRRRTGKDDSIRYHLSSRSPICPACGSGPPS